MQAKKRTNITADYIRDALKHTTRERIALSLGKPIWVMGRLSGAYEYIEYFKFNKLYPCVNLIETQSALIFDEVTEDTAERGKTYITTSTTHELLMVGDSKKCVVTKSVILYCSALIVAGLWAGVPQQEHERLAPIAQQLLQMGLHTITENETKGFL